MVTQNKISRGTAIEKDRSHKTKQAPQSWPLRLLTATNSWSLFSVRVLSVPH
ncbi:unnamed protein product, partial [Nesidiocoris tenuis]